MRVIVVASQHGNKTGLANFLESLRLAYAKFNQSQEKLSVTTVLLDSHLDTCFIKGESLITLNKYDLNAYVDLAEFVNEQADVCLLQHNFKMFGGQEGAYVLPFIYNLKVPLVSAFYAVEHEPNKWQQLVLESIAYKSKRIISMSSLGVDFLEHIYKIPRQKIVKIEHGVHEPSSVTRLNLRHTLGYTDKKVLVSYGLLRRQKGYEMVINALPAISHYFPEIKYIILGDAHPDTNELADEEYRNYLKLLAEKKGVSKYIEFVEHYVKEDDLMDVLVACDFFIAPHVDEHQINSGTLPHAIGAGAAIISTPFWHANELLDDQRGVFVPFKDASVLADKILSLIRRPREVEVLRQNAALYGQQLFWPKVAHKYLNVLLDVRNHGYDKAKPSSQLFNLTLLPKVNFSFIDKLMHPTGLINKTISNVLDLNSGFTLKDSSTGLLNLTMANRFMEIDFNEQITQCIQAIQYMRKNDGTFYPAVSYHGRYCEDAKEVAGVGRLAWAMGMYYGHCDDMIHRDLVYSLFLDALKVEASADLKTLAEVVIGCAYYLEKDRSNTGVFDMMKSLVTLIIKKQPNENTSKWLWFEETIDKGSVVLILALLHVHRLTGELKYLNQARKALKFYEKVMFVDNYYTPSEVNEKGYITKDKGSSDQFSSDVYLLVSCYGMLYKTTGEDEYLSKMFKTHLWFLGENNLNRVVYDYASGGCYEGFAGKSLIVNKGADSTLCYWLSYFTLMEVYFLSFKNKLKLEEG